MKSLATLLGIAIIMLVAFAAVKSKSGQPIAASSPSSPMLSPTPGESAASPSSSPTASPQAKPENSKMIATIATTLGDIKLELFAQDAPKTVANFKALADKNYYKDVTFHRVIKDFMIQGGDPLGAGAGGESSFGKPFADEINSHKIVPGTLAMANAGPNTNGSQFFIITEQPQPHLDGKHTVFGQVIEGMAVVKKIAAVKTDANDKPIEPVKMTKVTVEEAK